MKTKKIYLKKGKDEALKRFHPWIFSGAINRIDKGILDGDLVDVISTEGEFLAKGHYQEGSITVRVVSFRDETIDVIWWKNRLREAYKLRVELGLVDSSQTNCYRLVHGEGDNLPGLIIDIYGTTAVIQAHSIGMYKSQKEISQAIMSIMEGRVTAVYNKSSNTLPPSIGLTSIDGYLFGESSEAVVKENGYSFKIDWESGQKTGFFIDQRDNRELVKKYSNGKRVLNTFCYTGGFSIYALKGGAIHVDSVDSSQKAMELVDQNVKLNNYEHQHSSYCSDVFNFMRSQEAAKYDLIILDPPAFAKHQKALTNALQGYKRLNAKAMSMFEESGILFTFSCSQAVSKENFRNAVFSAAALAGKRVKILHQLTQPADHPVNIYHPEGEYLKGLVLYVENL